MFSYRTIIAAAMALASASAGAASAQGLKPIQAQTIDLGEVSGVAYYTVERDGFHLVATLAEQGDGAAPVRVETVLEPGQRVILSTPRGVGTAPETVEFSRQDNAVLVHASAVKY